MRIASSRSSTWYTMARLCGWRNSFLNPDYPEYVADYSRAFADHYRGLCYWYTPLNEPRINAWYAGRLGWWPPYAKNWHGFASVLAQLCRGICKTQQAIAEVSPGAVFVHVDATDLYLAGDPGDPALAEEARFRRSWCCLALDLVLGRVTRDHTLTSCAERHGIGADQSDWFLANAVRPDIIGYNMYPMFSRKVVTRSSRGGMQVKITPCWAETLNSADRNVCGTLHSSARHGDRRPPAAARSGDACAGSRTPLRLYAWQGTKAFLWWGTRSGLSSLW